MPPCKSTTTTLEPPPFATDLIRGTDPVEVAAGVTGFPVPGQTRGSVLCTSTAICCSPATRWPGIPPANGSRPSGVPAGTRGMLRPSPWTVSPGRSCASTACSAATVQATTLRRTSSTTAASGSSPGCQRDADSTPTNGAGSPPMGSATAEPRSSHGSAGAPAYEAPWGRAHHPDRADSRGEGLAAVAMSELMVELRSRFALGARSTDRQPFHQRLGWERWQGPTFVRDGVALRRTPEENNGIMVLRFGSQARPRSVCGDHL
jgi:hypothetical protein